MRKTAQVAHEEMRSGGAVQGTRRSIRSQRTLLGIKLGVALSSHVNVACPARRQSQPERVCKDQDQVSQLAGDLLLCAPAQLALKEACGRTALSSCALTRSTDDLDLSFACSRGGPVRLLVAPDARFECCCCCCCSSCSPLKCLSPGGAHACRHRAGMVDLH